MSSGAPTVSIGIRAWRATHLAEAIRSVLEQTLDDVEVIVADDAGDLEPIVAAIGDSRVRYHRNAERMGVAANVRVALGLARGRYLGLLGDDDRLLPGFLEATVRRLEEDPAVGLVFTNCYREKAGILREGRRPLREGRYDDFLPLLLRHFPVPISATLMRREVWEQGERELPFPGDVAPDVHLFVRAALAGWPFYYLDSPLMVYRVHEGQTSRSEAYRDRIVAAWEQFELADPECERLRRKELAEAYVGRAGALLRAGRPAEARADLERARATDRRVLRARRLALAALARRPELLPAAQAAWRLARRLRPA